MLGQIEPGKRRIDIRAVGYKPFTTFLEFAAGKTLEKTFELDFSGDQMPDLEVQARNSKTLPRFVEFERRLSRGVGHFITRDEISARGYMNMGDALRTVKGVKVYCDVLDCLEGFLRRGIMKVMLSAAPHEDDRPALRAVAEGRLSPSKLSTFR